MLRWRHNESILVHNNRDTVTADYEQTNAECIYFGIDCDNCNISLGYYMCAFNFVRVPIVKDYTEWHKILTKCI